MIAMRIKAAVICKEVPMFITNEQDHAFRHGDSGPKYFIHGPNLNFGIARVLPGEVYTAHRHPRMEEDFYVLEGHPTFIIDGKTHVGKPGDFIHMDPGEVHVIKNDTNAPCLYIITTTPFFEEGDKDEVVVDWA